MGWDGWAGLGWAGWARLGCDVARTLPRVDPATLGRGGAGRAPPASVLTLWPVALACLLAGLHVWCMVAWLMHAWKFGRGQSLVFQREGRVKEDVGCRV